MTKIISTLSTLQVDCNDTNYNQSVASIHEIEPTSHTDMVRNYFGSKNIAPKVVSKADLFLLITENECSSKCLRFWFDESQTDKNDIYIVEDYIGIYRDNTKPTNCNAYISYSHRLFKGLDSFFAGKIDKFEFSKGKVEPTSNYVTITMRLLDSNGNILVHCDLSNTFPIYSK